MKRSIITTFMAALTLMQTAHAQSISDLPDFGDIDGTTQQVPAVPPQTTTTTVQAQYAGSVSISGMSRKSGGTLYKVDLQQPLSLLRLDLRVTYSQLRIHQATIVTEGGQRIDVREYRNTAVLATGSVNSSENLNLSERVISIEILAESYSAEADVMLTAISDRGVPKLVLRVERPQGPVVPNRPDVPVRPGQDVRISAGDVVLSGPLNQDKYYSGRVLEVYGNGKALVRDDDDGKTYVRDLSLIGKRISCESSKGICERANVLSGPFTDNKYYYGTVTEVFSNGKIRVRDHDDGRIYVRGPKEVHVSLRCDSAGNCAGDRVLSGPFTNNKYYVGKIEGVYSNGLLSVRDDDDGKSYLRQANVVMKSVRCDERSRLCVKDEVLSGPYQDKYYSGVVEGIYSNGLIYVRDSDDGKLYTRKAGEVAKSVRCEGTKGICVNDRVVSGPFTNGAYYAGRVVGVYSSGIIRVQDDDDGKVYARKAQQITKTRN
ncbi:beta-sandwich domain-containing protein [Bdellovibrio sp. HCB-110]|uniref:beta-sandwich domain-containing protein n=1 Tax=Bdellovibrio sp. HCB-110 TaxID=3391182 RepID=UPI0039B5BD23